MNLIRNALKTPDGTIIESLHRYDFQSHKDANGRTYSTDGGLTHCVRAGPPDIVDMNLYDNEPHSVQREVLRWGTVEFNGDKALTWVQIGNMDSCQIERVLEYGSSCEARTSCMVNELEHRDEQKKGEEQ
tara:strand:- start:103 stop:492 length:390 start_codon:yes stop_codon:yes gene_type:complete